MANFCEKCQSILIEINDFKVCSNKKCNKEVKSSGYFSNKSNFVKNKITGDLVDKETGTTIKTNKKLRKEDKEVTNGTFR